MKKFLRQQLERHLVKLQELEFFLQQSDVTNDMPRYLALNKEHSEVGQIAQQFEAFKKLEIDLQHAKNCLMDAALCELHDLAKEEIQQIQANLLELEQTLQMLLLPQDANDARAAFVEIRAGTGGDESTLFAGDLLRMYLKFAERRGFSVEFISQSQSDAGGYKEVVVRIFSEQTEKVYGQLKFESGGHRVQRVPATETQGRIHTSACTVAVMPEPDETTVIAINPSDLRIDTYRSSGAGGQHINKTDSAVRITHLPTGTVAECQDDRSQHRNKAKAMQVLQARIAEKEHQSRQNKEAATRKDLVGTGDRSDRIRTYHFPQGRVTDHRVNLTLYQLNAVLQGNLDEFIDTLLLAKKAEQLLELELNLIKLN